MAQSRVYTLLVDSNVRTHVNKTSVRANPQMRAAQIISCGHVGVFRETLGKTRGESNVLIVSCMTNFLTDSEGPESVSQRIDPVLQDVREILDEFCQAHPAIMVLISPPMYRVAPVWYREGLPEVLTTFSQTMLSECPANLRLLGSFATPAFQPDGVHLTPYSGLQFLIHLFDGAEDLLDGLALSTEASSAKTSESTRVLEDRMMALEQDHKRLNNVVDKKIAVDSEAADFRENVGFLDHFVIVGLPQLPPDLVGKPWQDQAILDVQNVLKMLLPGRKMDIVFVSNSTKRHKDAEVTYTVKMREVRDSQAIRDKFGSYFVGGPNRLPENLKPYSIRNRVTPETKVRIAVLQVMAKRYKTSNPGSKVKVLGYEPRPRIKITPAQNASDRRIKNFTFIDAVRNLPTSFTASELDFIFTRVNAQLAGQVRSLFICLSDDEFRKRLKLRPRNAPAAAAEAGAETEAESETMSESGTEGPGDVAIAQEPGPTSSGSSLSRAGKRGATDSPSDASAPKR